MPRRFLVPIDLPADAGSALQAVPKQQLDAGLAAKADAVHAATHGTGGSDPVTPAAIGAVPTARTVTAGTGLAGGGDLTANRSLAVTYGVAAGTAAQGNDARLSDARTPTTHVHSGGDVTSGTVAAARLPLVPNPPVALTYASSVTPVASVGNYLVMTATGDLTLNPPTSPADGQMWRLRVTASGAQRTVTLAAGLRRPSHIASTLVIPSGRRGDIGLLYDTSDSAWTVLAAQAA